MESNTTNSPEISLHNRQGKDRLFILQIIRTQVENSTDKPFLQLIKEYSEISRYKLALWYVTTTNKAVCEAMYITPEAGTRFKRMLEKTGQLVSSTDEFRCPYTGNLAHLLSTNPKEYERLNKSRFSQLTLF
jgi:hypothetical protein